MKKASATKTSKESVEAGRPDIFNYYEYRVFLKEWLAYLKASQSDFSVRSLSAEAGIASGYLPMVLSGARTLTVKALDKILPLLKLEDSEKSYLRALLVLAGAKTQEERVTALARLQRFRLFKEENPQEVEVFKYLTKWHHVAIREMASIPGFRLDPQWICDHLLPSLSLKEAREGIEFLTAHGFLITTDAGTVEPSAKKLECFGEVYSTSLAQFHRQVLSMAVDSIVTVPRDERNILGHTFSITARQYERLRTIMNQALSEIADLEDESSGEKRLYHVGLVAFPLTRAASIGEED